MSESVNDSSTGSASISSDSVPIRAYRSIGSWLRFLIPAVVGVTADLWLKAWSFPDGVPADPMMIRLAGRHPAGDFFIDSSAPIPIIPHILGFTTTVNQGAVFGIGQGKVAIFLVFSIFALALILWVFLSSLRRQWMVHIALGLITAGAIGNLYDRAVYHGVRDMLKFYVDWYPYIFNIADVSLCIGVPILMARWLLVKDPLLPTNGPGFNVVAKPSQS